MNNYQIYEEIGQGRNSVVRKGRKKNTIEYFAIASYDKGQRARVNASVQFLRTLSHPNVLKFYNWYETGNHLWVITELCTGGNLRTILTEETKLPELSIRVLAADIARGLSYLHSRGVLYVELKPSNLLLDATGQLRFYDFGLAIVFSHADKAGRVGAPSFMAPERFEEGAVPSMASDLWGFGCVLYEMAAGKPPFDGSSTIELISNIVSTAHKPLEGPFSKEFTQLVDGLLRKDPSKRATWADVVASGVFANFVAPEQFPKQPHFEAYIRQKYGDDRNTVSRETQKREHDVLRASINAERNLNRTKGVRSDQSSLLAAARAVVEGEGKDNKEQGASRTQSKNTSPTERKEDSLSSNEEDGGAEPAKKPFIIETNDTLIDGKVTALRASAAKARMLDMEMDFRDQDAVDDPTKDNGGAGAAELGEIVPPIVDHDSNIRNGGGIVEDNMAVSGGVPSVTSPSGVDFGPPPASAPHTQHPQTPMEKQQQRSIAGPSSVAEVTSMEDLMSHPQDAHLRPLVGNYRIERYVESKVDLVALKQSTGITPIPPLQLRELPKEKKDAFLTSIYEAIAPSASSTAPPLSLSDKVALMGYFESLCSDAQVAETVANCSLMTLFSQVASVHYAPPTPTAAPTPPAEGGAGGSSAAKEANPAAVAQLRLQVASVMGLLVRHSNFIDDAVHGATLIPTLIASFKAETHPKVKRKLLACLGELLFYITSRPPAQRLSWRVDGASIAEVYASALHDADEVLVHYAAKMIENTCSVADVTAAALFKFTTQPIVSALLTRYDASMAPVAVAGAGTTAVGANRTNSFIEHLRVALACAALKLCLVEHSLFPFVLTWPTMEPVTFLNEVASYNNATNKENKQQADAPVTVKHNPKVIQAYLSVLIGLFAKTITLAGPACAHFTKNLNWAKQDSSASCSVFSAAACPSSANLFAIDSPVLGKIRQTIATMMPRFFKNTFFSHNASPIRAKSCLLLALLIISDECGVTAPPSNMLLRAFAAEADNGGSNSSSLRSVIAQLSRDSADVQVQKCADAITAVAQVAAVNAITNLSQGKPLLPPPAPADSTTTALYLDLSYHCLSSNLCVNISSIYEQPLTVLTTLGKVLHRAASDPAQFAQQLEGLLQLVETVASRALKLAEQQGMAMAKAQQAKQANAASPPIAGDSVMPVTSAAMDQNSNADAAKIALNNAIAAKTREVAKVLASVVLPAMLPTLDGAITRSTEAPLPVTTRTPALSRPPSAALRPQSASSTAAAATTAQQQLKATPPPPLSAIGTSLPSHLLPSSATEVPFILLKFINDLLIPIVNDIDVMGSGDISNSVYLFGKQLVKLVPRLLALKGLVSASSAPLSNNASAAIPPLEGGSLGNNSFSNSAAALKDGSFVMPSGTSPPTDLLSTLGPTCGSMIINMTLRVLGLLCDACPALTQELRTNAFIDDLMPVAKLPPLQINNQVLVLLLRLLKVTPEAGSGMLHTPHPPGGAGGGGSVQSSTASASASMLMMRSSRTGAVAPAHATHTTLDLDILKHCVTKHSLLQWAMQTALKCLPEWSALEEIVASLMELVFLIVYAASQNTGSEMAMVCGHLVAGADTTPLESLLLRICVQHPSAVAAADCASSCIFLLVGLFEEARQLLTKPRVLTQIREVLNKTCFVKMPASDTATAGEQHSNNGGGGVIYPHVAAPLLQSLVVLARVAGPEQLQRDELLLMQVQQICDQCPNEQIASLCGELVKYLLQ